MNAGLALAEEAGRLVGCRFRLHGRDPASGLDCVGVVAVALAACGQPHALPAGYTLKTRDWAPFAGVPGSLGFVAVDGSIMPGDVVAMRAGPCQFHLAIAARPDGFIHAHAGLRRVVRSAEIPSGALVGHWRLAPARLGSPGEHPLREATSWQP